MYIFKLSYLLEERESFCCSRPISAAHFLVAMNTALFDTDVSKIPANKKNLAIAYIIVMGDAQSGKTSLIFRWLNGTYNRIAPGAYMEDIYSKSYKQEFMAENPYGKNGKNGNNGNTRFGTELKRHAVTHVSFLDMESVEKTYNSEMRNIQLKESDAFVIAFDPTCENPIKSIRTQYKLIEDATDLQDKPPIVVICSTKCDLEADYRVGLDQILEFMDRAGLPTSNFFQVSAKSGEHTTRLLYYVLQQIKKRKIAANEEAKTYSDTADTADTATAVAITRELETDAVKRDTELTQEMHTVPNKEPAFLCGTKKIKTKLKRAKRCVIC